MSSAILFPSITTNPPRTYPFPGEKVKGRGYYNSGGLHTVQYTTVNGFIGVVKIQATLTSDPAESDWFDVDGSVLGDGVIPVPDQTSIINFTGNFVWVRAVIVNLTAGELNRVLLNQN